MSRDEVKEFAAKTSKSPGFWMGLFGVTVALLTFLLPCGGALVSSGRSFERKADAAIVRRIEKDLAKVEVRVEAIIKEEQTWRKSVDRRFKEILRMLKRIDHRLKQHK